MHVLHYNNALQLKLRVVKVFLHYKMCILTKVRKGLHLQCNVKKLKTLFN